MQNYLFIGYFKVTFISFLFYSDFVIVKICVKHCSPHLHSFFVSKTEILLKYWGNIFFKGIWSLSPKKDKFYLV
jgi:hypothetical protein